MVEWSTYMEHFLDLVYDKLHGMQNYSYFPHGSSTRVPEGIHLNGEKNTRSVNGEAWSNTRGIKNGWPHWFKNREHELLPHLPQP